MDKLSLTIGLLAALVATVWWLIHRTYTYWERRGVPTIPSTIPYGHFGEVGKTISHSELMKSIYDRLKGKAPFCGVYSFHRPLALITDLELIRKVMITDFTTFHDRGTYHNAKADPLSANMVSVEGQEWRDFRHKFATIFTSGKMKNMYGVVVDVADELVKVVALEAQKNRGVLEMKDLLSSYTTDVIGVCAFGLECNSLQSADVSFRRMGKRVFENPRNSPAYQLFISSFQGLARFLGCRINSEEVEQFYMEIIKKTVAYREANNVKRNDLLDMLIELKNNGFGLTIEQIAAEAFAFFLAGFGTTSTMMSFALYEVALSAELQNKLRSEIYKVLAQHEGELTYESVTDMTYLNQVFDESLRKYPPFGNHIRVAMHDYRVPGTNQVLQKGTSVWIPVLALHHDPAYYPEPQRFDPDRFSVEAKRHRNPTTFLPFGQGPRVCIGIRFAMMKARVAFVKLLTNFEFSACAETRVPCGISRKTFLYTVDHAGIKLAVKPLTDDRRRY